MSTPKTWLRSVALGAAALLVLAACGGGSEPTQTTTTTDPGSQTTAASSVPSAPSEPSAPATGGTDFDELMVGECLQFLEVPGATPDAAGNISVTHEVVDCNLAGQFKHLVTHSFDGPANCPNEDYTTYFQEGFLGGQSKSFCLAPVFEAGASYAQEPINDFVAVDAANPDKVFTIESVLEGVDPAGCVDQTYAPFILPEPAPGKVYCLAP